MGPGEGQAFAGTPQSYESGKADMTRDVKAELDGILRRSVEAGEVPGVVARNHRSLAASLHIKGRQRRVIPR